SARYLSKCHTPVDTNLGQRLESCAHNPIEEPLLGSTILTQSSPVLKTKTTLCLVSTLTFLGVFNLLQSLDTTIHSMGSKPRQEFVIYVGRKLLQDSGNQLLEHGVAGHSSIGTLLGWAMAVMYMGGRLPQICLNGINPLMFLFAVTGNVTYVASILVRSLDWSRIGPNLPWLIEPGGCALLDIFVSIFYIHRTSQVQ
ncbi:Ypq1, partial [Mucuna pruriens]